MSCVIINLPYTSTAIPEALAKRLAFTPEELQLEHWRLIDPYLGEIVREAAVSERQSLRVERPVIHYPFSPLVADPWGSWATELAPTDNSEAREIPTIFTQSTAGRPINWSPKDRETIFQRTTQPFHQQVEKEIYRTLEDNPLVLLITLRSFSPWPPKRDRADIFLGQKLPGGMGEPQVCIITREKATPLGLANLAGGIFQTLGWWPVLNWPQAHGAVLPPGLEGNRRVLALGLSLNRSLYLDEKTGRRRPTFSRVARVLRTLFNLLNQELKRVSRVRLDRLKGPPSPVIKAKKDNR